MGFTKILIYLSKTSPRVVKKCDMDTMYAKFYEYTPIDTDSDRTIML